MQDDLPFVFCGLEGPVRVDEKVRMQVLQICKRLVQTFHLKGFNGIDLVVSQSTVYFLELNPRITASFCLLQESYEFCFLDEHIRLTSESASYNHVDDSFLQFKNETVAGFRIIYAKKDFQMDEMFQKRLFKYDFIIDIPRKKYWFKKHDPICSVFLKSDSLSKLEATLNSKVEFVYSKLARVA